MQSESECRLGNFDRSLAIVDEGLALGERTGAELLREKGEALLGRLKDAKAEAEVAFGQAIKISHGQNASLLELRAAKKLSSLWGDQNKRAAAHDLLSPVFGGFSEGLDTPELLEAKALLDALA